MTTQACNLASRIPPGPMRVQRSDRTEYVEYDAAEIAVMIRAGIVEGVGPRSGRIDILRMICDEEEAVSRITGILPLIARRQTGGSITSQASREVFREKLSDAFWTWCHKGNRGLSMAA